MGFRGTLKSFQKASFGFLMFRMSPWGNPQAIPENVILPLGGTQAIVIDVSRQRIKVRGERSEPHDHIIIIIIIGSSVTLYGLRAGIRGNGP